MESKINCTPEINLQCHEQFIDAEEITKRVAKNVIKLNYVLTNRIYRI